MEKEWKKNGKRMEKEVQIDKGEIKSKQKRGKTVQIEVGKSKSSEKKNHS